MDIPSMKDIFHNQEHDIKIGLPKKNRRKEKGNKEYSKVIK